MSDNTLTMDSVFKRLRQLCQLQHEAEMELKAVSAKLEEIREKISTYDHELANIATLAGGWRLMAEADGLDVAPTDGG
jgi:hypothetical protein